MIWLFFLSAFADPTPDDAEPKPVTEIRPDDGHPEEVIEVGGERNDVGLKRRVEPVFPSEARKLGLSFGRCVADVQVTPAGTPGKPTFVDCPEAFQQSAREALRQWRWHEDGGGDGVSRDVNTRVVIDYHDTSAAALLADPDPLSTPMGEFGSINDDRASCVGHATMSASGQVIDKSANHLPACIFEPAEAVIGTKKPLNVLASCTVRFSTRSGYAVRLKYSDCPGSVRSAAGRNIRAWTWPWSPESPVEYEMMLTFLAD